MSAITPTNTSIQDTAFYRTRVKAIFHTHASNTPIELKQEIRGFGSNKSLKGPGSLTIKLVADRNYLNYIFPNDYVNFYVDRGDGEGWQRLFFGYVDRINEEYSVDTSSGTPSTSYTISCSDFSKAFEQTMIYFNPQLNSDREDFDASWLGVPNIGGLALKTKGLAAVGTPPDVIINTLFVLIGASCQFILPTGMVPATKDKYRQRKAEFAIGRLQADMLRSVPNGSEVSDFLEKAQKVINSQVSPGSVKNVLHNKNLDKALQDSGLIKEFVDSVKGATSDQKQQAIGVLASNTQVRASLLDLLDVFTFVEREAIDGYSDGVTIWQHEGSVMSFLTQQSNEVINELFFDLRPTSDVYGSGGFGKGTDWSRTRDEIGHNVTGDLPPGIRYVPALIMREYPFSTIDYLDASDVKLSLAGEDGEKVSVGKIPFGAIFSDKPNVKGRHVVEVDNINLEDRIKGKTGSAFKHLDVAVIEPTEITASSLGRSDHEHFNLMTFLSDGVLGRDSRNYMQDILPIISPIHIARHGLRVREISSTFARFGSEVLPKLNNTQDEEESDPDVEEVGTGAVVSPIDPALYNAGSRYGWRARSLTPGGPPRQVWRFHHGLDLGAAEGVPVMSVADGYVVAVAISGTPRFKGYGNCVVIQHKEPFNGQTVFSLYAHMVSIDANIVAAGNPRRLLDVSAACAPELLSVGKMTKFFIPAGTVIGGVGSTDFADASGTQTNYGSNIVPHLHFEIIKKYPAKNTPVGVPAPVPYESSTPPPNPDFSLLSSINPLDFFTENGINILEVPDFNPDGDDKDDEDTDTSFAPQDGLDEIDIPSVGSTSPGNLDNSKIRSQIARWALLHDHWYQHNLEYLSGNISMRGAPEIRVGYRLDINDPLRPLSFYVEGVEHSWEYPSAMTTSLTVTRGQPNNPFPVYVLPFLKGISDSKGQRKENSRLGNFFMIPSPKSADNGVFSSEAGVKTAARTEKLKNVDQDLINNGSPNKELFIPAGESLGSLSTTSSQSARQLLMKEAVDALADLDSVEVLNNASNIRK